MIRLSVLMKKKAKTTYAAMVLTATPLNSAEL
jgi:hypothetical protein